MRVILQNMGFSFLNFPTCFRGDDDLITKSSFREE